jgi:hypothetical protein
MRGIENTQNRLTEKRLNRSRNTCWVQPSKSNWLLDYSDLQTALGSTDLKKNM